jgi:prepilin-type processing-associated H-X9-DG protein
MVIPRPAGIPAVNVSFCDGSVRFVSNTINNGNLAVAQPVTAANHGVGGHGIGTVAIR